MYKIRKTRTAVLIFISIFIALAFYPILICDSQSEEEASKFSIDLDEFHYSADRSPGSETVLSINGKVTLVGNWTFESSVIIVDLDIDSEWNHTAPNDVLFRKGNTSLNFSFDLFVPPGGVHNQNPSLYYCYPIYVTGEWSSQTCNISGDCEMGYIHVNANQYFGISLDERSYEINMEIGERENIQVNLSNTGNGYDEIHFKVENQDVLGENFSVTFRKLQVGKNQDTFKFSHNESLKIIVRFISYSNSTVPGDHEVILNISSSLSNGSKQGPVYELVHVDLTIERPETIRSKEGGYGDIKEIIFASIGLILIVTLIVLLINSRKIIEKNEKR